MPDVQALQTATRVLQRYPEVGVVERVNLPAAPGFSGAIVWQVATERGRFAVRRCDSEQMARQNVPALHRFLHWLGQELGNNLADLPATPRIPLPLLNTAGESLTHCAGHVWQVEHWLPGTADESPELSPARLQSAMHTLARLHHTARNYESPVSDADRFPALRTSASPTVHDRIRRLQNWLHTDGEQLRKSLQLAGELTRTSLQPCPLVQHWLHTATPFLTTLQQHGPRLLSELLRFRETDLPLQPVLRDIHRQHVLFNEADMAEVRVSAVIDLNACRCDSVAVDLARLIASYAPATSDNSAARSTHFAAALHAYHEANSLSKSEWTLAVLLADAGDLLSGLNWLHRRFLAPAANPHLQQDSPPARRALARLQEIAARLPTKTLS